MKNENLGRDEASARSALLATESYSVDLDLSGARTTDETTYPSTTTVVFTCNEPGASTFLDFIGDVVGVELNGEALDPSTASDGARVRLPGLAAHNTVTVRGLARYSTSGEGLHRFVDPVDGETYLYTQYEPADARRVFACFEQPDLKASFTFAVVAPSDWTVASNGAEADVVAMEEFPTPVSRWSFAPTLRISTYITTVLAGPYHRVADAWTGRPGTKAEGLEVPLALYCRRSLRSSLDEAENFDTTKRGLDFFHEVFDYPYPFGKYAQAFVPEYNLGAMENPGLVTFTEDYLFRSAATEAQREARATTIMHEMAHMWFGDLVTMSWWDDLWLKESFADYMGSLAVAEATRWSSSWVSFANRRKAWAYVQDQLPTTHPIVADIPDLEAAKQNFDGITYAKGASVLKQLVAYVGRDAFFSAARQYFTRHAYANTTLADLLEVLTDATGQDLAAWSRAWLLTSGVPSLRAEVTVDDGGRLTGVAIVQDATDPVTGEQQPRPHRIRVGLYRFDADGWLVRESSEAVTVEGARTPVPALVGRTQPDLLLVNDDDLTYARISFDERSLSTLLSKVHRLRDPLARATCLGALWSSTRDAGLSVPAYLGAVLLAAPAETDVGVLQVLLANAHAAIETFAPAPQRPELHDRLGACLSDGLRTAHPGSDLQLVWARALALAARSATTSADAVRAVLDGEPVPGLRLDAELRWLFLQGLAAQGRILPGELEAEREADATASGRAEFTLASAAIPDAALKKATWEEAVHDDQLSNTLLSAAIEGFALGPRDLLVSYEEPYFEMLRTVWGTRGIEMASRIVRGLYPRRQDLGSTPGSHPVVVRTDAWLTRNADAPAALRRIIVEERDHLLRSLRAQAQGTR